PVAGGGTVRAGDRAPAYVDHRAAAARAVVVPAHGRAVPRQSAGRGAADVSDSQPTAVGGVGRPSRRGPHPAAPGHAQPAGGPPRTHAVAAYRQAAVAGPPAATGCGWRLRRAETA